MFNTKSLFKQRSKVPPVPSVKATCKTLIHKTQPIIPNAQTDRNSLHPSTGIDPGKNNLIVRHGFRRDHAASCTVAFDRCNVDDSNRPFGDASEDGECHMKIDRRRYAFCGRHGACVSTNRYPWNLARSYRTCNERFDSSWRRMRTGFANSSQRFVPQKSPRVPSDAGGSCGSLLDNPDVFGGISSEHDVNWGMQTAKA
jgi:hypothetical protein